MYRDARRRAISRDIIIDMMVGTIVFSVIYDVVKSMLDNNSQGSEDTSGASREREIETVEAIVVQDDSDDEGSFRGQRIIIDIMDDSESEETNEEHASDVIVDTEIIETTDTGSNTDNKLP